MISVTQHVWTQLGEPDCQRPIEPTADLCTLCGAPCGGLGVLSALAFGDSFSDFRDLAVPASPYICRACVWAMRGKPPNTLRSWSVLWRSDGQAPPSRGPVGSPHVYTTNKADMAPLLAVLRDPPACQWAMAIADSGQIHTLPFAIINMPRAQQWQIRYERNDVRMRSAEFCAIHDLVDALYRAGFSRNEIQACRPNPSTVAKRGIEIWRDLGGRLRPYANSKQLELACSFLRRKDKTDDGRAVDRPGCGHGALDDALGAERHDPAAGLVATGKDGAGDRCRQGRDGGKHDQRDGAQAPDPSDAGAHQQLPLFPG